MWGLLTAPVGFSPVQAAPPENQPARMVAEWEPAVGALVVWPVVLPPSLLVELARDDVLYTLVQSESAESDARSSYQSWGVDMGNVAFIYAWLNSVWTRDWGPLMIFDGSGGVGITDPWFNGYPSLAGCAEMAGNSAAKLAGEVRRSPAGYDDDDAINATLADFFDWPRYEMPSFCTGGNIMTDGMGTAMSTRLMMVENLPFINEAQFRGLAHDYLGIERYLFFDNPEEYGIQHIDCYAKLLDPETVLIKQLPTWHQEYECVERLAGAVSALTSCYGRPYRVVRIYCDTFSGSSAAAYTNSLILNDKVLVPLFGIPSDYDALDTYAEAMPGYDVHGFEYDHWYDYDALHCRVMGIFDPGMLRLSHGPLNAEVYYNAEYEITATIKAHSGAGLVTGETRVYWRLDGDVVWQDVPLVRTTGDSFTGSLPGQPAGSIVHYYLSARDSSGREETLPPSAPGGFFTFEVVGNPTSIRTPRPAAALAITSFPNPGSGGIFARLTLPAAGPAIVEVFDVSGRHVRSLLRGVVVESGRVVAWDGRDEQGRDCPSGVYFMSLRAGALHSTARCVLLR